MPALAASENFPEFRQTIARMLRSWCSHKRTSERATCPACYKSEVKRNPWACSASAVGLGLFLFYVWPTPYVIHRHAGEIIRVNRFTGVRDTATDNGWWRPAQLSAEEIAQKAEEEEEARSAERLRIRAEYGLPVIPEYVESMEYTAVLRSGRRIEMVPTRPQDYLSESDIANIIIKQVEADPELLIQQD